MIDYMLLNLGFLASNIGLKPEDVVPNSAHMSVPVPDDSIPPQAPIGRPIRQSLSRADVPMTIAESFYSPIRRSDFL